MTVVRKPKPPVAAPSAGQPFALLVAFYATAHPHVDRVKLFGFDCLRTAGKVFAKLHSGKLVMKLPARRIATLVDSGQVRPYDYGRGRWMREWAVVTATDKRKILALAEESRAFTEG